MRQLLLSMMICCCLTSYGQQKPMAFQDSLFSTRLPITKWSLSINPVGLMEAPAAAGIGVGYRLNEKIELWSETSFLTNGFFKTQGPVTGIRQILEGKYYLGDNRNFFVGAEIRYKSYQYRDTENFTNPATHDTLLNFSNFGRHYFFGAALQVGVRVNLDKKGRFQAELTTGLGLRDFKVERQDVPTGYRYFYFHSIDPNIIQIQSALGDLYFPGSVRLYYQFGKHLRP